MDHKIVLYVKILRELLIIYTIQINKINAYKFVHKDIMVEN
jgi:hypothetical protein